MDMTSGLSPTRPVRVAAKKLRREMSSDSASDVTSNEDYYSSEDEFDCDTRHKAAAR